MDDNSKPHMAHLFHAPATILELPGYEHLITVGWPMLERLPYDPEHATSGAIATREVKRYSPEHIFMLMTGHTFDDYPDRVVELSPPATVLPGALCWTVQVHLGGGLPAVELAFNVVGDDSPTKLCNIVVTNLTMLVGDKRLPQVIDKDKPYTEKPLDIPLGERNFRSRFVITPVSREMM